MTVRSPRPAALVSLVLTAVAVVYLVITITVVLSAGDGALDAWQSSSGYLLQALIHLGELAGVIALALSGAAGAGLLARIGLGAAMLGLLLLAVAELVYPTNPGIGEQIFNVAPLLSGIGLLLAGIAVLRATVWQGWHRFVPLVLGAWVFVVMAPALIVSGGPPAPVALLAIAGWDVVWVLLAVAVLAGAGVHASRRPAAAATADAGPGRVPGTTGTAAP